MKMETPKMDVVRFQEADVIVASGYASPVMLTGFNDVTAKNGQVAFTNNGSSFVFNTADYGSQESFSDAVVNAGVADVYFNNGKDPDNHSLAGLYYADAEEDGGGKSLLLDNGAYFWNPSKRAYIKQ